MGFISIVVNDKQALKPSMLFWILVHYACILPVSNCFLYVKALFGDLDVNNNGIGLFWYTRLLAWGIILPEPLSFQFQYSSDDY